MLSGHREPVLAARQPALDASSGPVSGTLRTYAANAAPGQRPLEQVMQP
jgi:hypothetical protein